MRARPGLSQGEQARARAEAAWEGVQRGPAPRHAYDGASRRGTFLADWRANIRSADAEWIPDRDRAVARARDVGRNSVLGASAAARRVNSAVGFGWKLSSRPNARALGIEPDAARELGAQLQTIWEGYAEGIERQADAERQLSFGQLLRACAAHAFVDGEAVGLVEYAADEPTQFKTRLRLVDPDRLSNPNGQPDSPTLRGGIETNSAGVRIRAWIREQHPYDLGTLKSMIWNPWDITTDWGRPVFLHAYDKLRAGQTRGVTRFVAALKEFRAFQSFTDATLETATINALVAGYVKSNAGPDKVSESFEGAAIQEFEAERQDHYDENPVRVHGSIVPILPFGDELELLTTSRDTAGFDAFTRAIIRLIAASLGVTYEELSMDFSQTNYSSARAALAVAWPETLMLRQLLETQIVQPFYGAVIEEAFDLGLVVPPAGAPDFYAARDAYCRAVWRGPGRGYIDPTKEILAAAARIEAGVSSLDDECAEQGKDAIDVMEAQAFEEAERNKIRAKFGLPPLGPQALPVTDRQTEAALQPQPEAPEGQPAPEDQRPGDKPAARGALAQIAGVADTAEHMASLDARPGDRLNPEDPR